MMYSFVLCRSYIPGYSQITAEVLAEHYVLPHMVPVDPWVDPCAVTDSASAVYALCTHKLDTLSSLSSDSPWIPGPDKTTYVLFQVLQGHTEAAAEQQPVIVHAWWCRLEKQVRDLDATTRHRVQVEAAHELHVGVMTIVQGYVQHMLHICACLECVQRSHIQKSFYRNVIASCIVFAEPGKPTP